MRLIHTADWHLGHTLREQPRDEEHAAFLGWLLDLLDDRDVDALIIAGDVFESANPPTRALKMFYGFLAEARRRCPTLDVLVIGGNHDSAQRLDAPGPLYAAAGVTVVGAPPKTADGDLDAERLLVPLHDASGGVAAWAVAMPFLRPADLPKVEDGDPLISGVRALYDSAIDLARARRGDGQAIIATGHCYMADTRLSELSERKILGGNQHALPAQMFPDDVAYVALGHLHLAQEVGAPRIRYSGSPIPLSMAEAGYTHQVVQVDLDGAEATHEILPIPRTVDLLRLPEDGPLPVEGVLSVLAALPPLPPGTPHWTRPFLEVSVAIEAPSPDLRRRVEAALEGRLPRLVSLKVERLGKDSSLADSASIRLDELSEEAVFRRRYAALRKGEPSPELLETFHELLDQIRAAEGA